MENREGKTRSPRYPQIGLREAIDRIRMIYLKEHRHRADKEVIAKDLGYTGLNGASLGMIASLKQYNLLENVGDGWRVSEDAVTILELPHVDMERADALQRVAFAPKIFTELSQVYGDRLPSDENLRLYLVKRGFNSKAAGIVIRTYRDTISLVKEEGQDYNSGLSAITQHQEADKLMPVPTSLHKQESQESITNNPFIDFPAPDQGEALLYRVADDCKVRVIFSGRVTQEAIEKLIKYLQLGKDDFPSKKQTDQEERRIRLDETIPGGRYLVEGKIVNAHGEEIE